MICPVCRKDYPGGDCPRCRFPEIHILGDYRSGLAQMQPEIDAYRSEFRQQLEIGLIVCHWRDEGGKLVPDREECVLIGSVSELSTEKWADRLFARIPELPELQLRVLIRMGDEDREVGVSIPNLMQPLLQTIGARMTDEEHFCILLRNEQQTVASAPVALFA